MSAGETNEVTHVILHLGLTRVAERAIFRPKTDQIAPAKSLGLFGKFAESGGHFPPLSRKVCELSPGTLLRMLTAGIGTRRR